MLIIISDIINGGTCGKSIQVSAFSLFSDRLKELAMNASCGWMAATVDQR